MHMSAGKRRQRHPRADTGVQTLVNQCHYHCSHVQSATLREMYKKTHSLGAVRRYAVGKGIWPLEGSPFWQPDTFGHIMDFLHHETQWYTMRLLCSRFNRWIVGGEMTPVRAGLNVHTVSFETGSVRRLDHFVDQLRRQHRSLRELNLTWCGRSEELTAPTTIDCLRTLYRVHTLRLDCRPDFDYDPAYAFDERAWVGPSFLPYVQSSGISHLRLTRHWFGESREVPRDTPLTSLLSLDLTLCLVRDDDVTLIGRLAPG